MAKPQKFLEEKMTTQSTFPTINNFSRRSQIDKFIPIAKTLPIKSTLLRRRRVWTTLSSCPPTSTSAATTPTSHSPTIWIRIKRVSKTSPWIAPTRGALLLETTPLRRLVKLLLKQRLKMCDLRYLIDAVDTDLVHQTTPYPWTVKMTLAQCHSVRLRRHLQCLEMAKTLSPCKSIDLETINMVP